MKSSNEPPAKKPKTGLLDDFQSDLSEYEEDIFRTGAKPVKGEDPKKSGVQYHRMGIGRTKGGRGDQSWSMSCSGKDSKFYECFSPEVFFNIKEPSSSLKTSGIHVYTISSMTIIWF